MLRWYRLRIAIRTKIREMSLPKKMKLLLANAGAHAKVDYQAFVYDKRRLAALDEMRHEIIHGQGIAIKIEDKNSQEFLYHVVVYAIIPERWWGGGSGIWQNDAV